MTKFLDLSGYMFSGKTAISDIIREHLGFYVPSYHVEFDLMRVPHGLLDLKHALVDEWSWLRSDRAIREFIQLTDVMGRSPKGAFEKLFRPGFGYSSNYPGFEGKTRQFVADITESSWPMQWPYDAPSLSAFNYAKLRVASKLRGAHPWPLINYRLCSGEQFMDRAKQYVFELLSDSVDLNEFQTIVTHNMLEPYDPTTGHCFFDHIKSIVIDRDVRDIYMTSIVQSHGFNDMVQLYSKIIGAFDINIFIKRQRILRNNTNYSESKNILRIFFEDAVLDYERTCTQIHQFLDIPPEAHRSKLKHFDPEKSNKNVGLWKSATREQLPAIRRLEKELPHLCRI
jgi:hypothetical protein